MFSHAPSRFASLLLLKRGDCIVGATCGEYGLQRNLSLYRAAVYNGLGVLVAAQYNKEI